VLRHRNHPKPPLHHEDDRVLQALRLLVDQGMIQTIDELIAYAEKGDHQKEAEFFRALRDEPIPVSLALDELFVINRKNGHRRDRELFVACAGRRVALLMPLPPHVLDEFLGNGNVTVLISGGHHIPPHLRHSNIVTRHGFRACRQTVAESDVVVFEAYVEGNSYFCESEVADLVDERMLQPDARLVIHSRPHAHPEDVAVDVGSRNVNLI